MIWCLVWFYSWKSYQCINGIFINKRFKINKFRRCIIAVSSIQRRKQPHYAAILSTRSQVNDHFRMKRSLLMVESSFFYVALSYDWFAPSILHYPFLCRCMPDLYGSCRIVVGLNVYRSVVGLVAVVLCGIQLWPRIRHNLRGRNDT